MSGVDLMKMFEKARRLNPKVSGIGYSKRKGKRFIVDIGDPTTQRIHFGSKNGKTYIDHGDKKKRIAWKARHKKIMKQGKPAYLDKSSPEFYSWHLLW
jgi:hypothetical protein